MSVVLALVQFIVGMVLLLNTLMLFVPDTPQVAQLKSKHGVAVKVVGDGMNWIVAGFSDVAFVIWVSNAQWAWQ